jgi:hypothetical protein
MTCSGFQADYLCEGWREMAARTRERDGRRCRGCDRGEDQVRLEVHHRRYGAPGRCGSCVLTGVTDDDLATLCADCHEAITSVRRRARYADRLISPEHVETIEPRRVVITTRVEIDPEHIAAIESRREIVSTRVEIDADAIADPKPRPAVVTARRQVW